MQSLVSEWVSPRSVRRSRSAVGPLPRLCGLPVIRIAPTRINSQRHPLFEFSFPPECSSAVPRRPATARRLLPWALLPLQHLQGLKVHVPQAVPACFVPPSGFGDPLDGLLPSVPGRLCYAPAALLGFAPRSHGSTRRCLTVTRQTHPHSVFRIIVPSGRSLPGRTDPPRIPGFRPSRKLVLSDVQSTPTEHEARVSIVPSKA